MGFIPPLNLGGFQPSPATLAQWVYQIWQYLQENPIATQEQLQEYIGTFITTSPETQAMIGEGVEQYLIDNPPSAPVQSVQGKTGAVQLAYNEIVPASNAVPVYKASSTPSTNTLVGQYNLGYRLFVNTATQEIFTISPAGALSLVGRGKFDGTSIDLNTSVGDDTIAEVIADINTTIGQINDNVSAIESDIDDLQIPIIFRQITFSGTIAANATYGQALGVRAPAIDGYKPVGIVGAYLWGAGTYAALARSWVLPTGTIDIIAVAISQSSSARSFNGRCSVMYMPTARVDTNISAVVDPTT